MFSHLATAFSPRKLCKASLLGLLLAVNGFYSVNGYCADADDKLHREGEYWYSNDGCEIYYCGKESLVEAYDRICPPVPDCLPGKSFMKDCCMYCDQGTLEIVENEYPEHDCKRSCKSGESLTCRYNFTLNMFQTMSEACFDCPFNEADCDRENCIPADGVSRLISVANRMMPGPSIEVCVNDTIVVDVVNRFDSEITTIHWHGQPQTLNCYADGNPFVTQCPIDAFTTFRYVFAAENAGTHFWHAEVGLQAMDGNLGPLIIRKPAEEDPQKPLYDFDDHVMFLQDWNHQFSNQKFIGYHTAGLSNFPDSLLVNGRGRIFSKLHSKYVFPPSKEEQAHRKYETMPFTKFTVKQGYRYRFRIINAAASYCALAIHFDNHTMLHISQDGNDIDPVPIDWIVTANGERFDFVINAYESVDNYWIRIKAVCQCTDYEIQQFAILHYEGAQDEEPNQPTNYDYPKVTGIQLGNVPINHETGAVIGPTDLRSIYPIEAGLDQKSTDYKFYLGIAPTDLPFILLMASPEVKPEMFYQFNKITLLKSNGNMLTQPLEDPAMVCNETSLKQQHKNCSEELCFCLHLLKIDLHATVELIFFTDENNPHKGLIYPFHLHGCSFYVVASQQVEGLTEEKLKKMDQQGKIKRNYDRPIYRDTFTVPVPGYSIIRFKADNPGQWYISSQILFHMNSGMGIILSVGEPEDLPSAPTKFPKCSSYEPNN